MFTITQSDEQAITIQCGAHTNVLQLSAVTEVAALHQQLGEWLADQRADGYLSSGEAVAIAAAAGYSLPLTTINSACNRKQIPDARKRRKRWQIPRTSFEIWFRQWKSVQERRANAPQ